MKIKLYAMLRSKAGLSSLDVATPPGSTVRHILTDLTTRCPALTEAIWDEQGGLTRYVHVLLNGRDVHYLNGLDTPVRADDAIDVFPPVGGG